MTSTVQGHAGVGCHTLHRQGGHLVVTLQTTPPPGAGGGDGRCWRSPTRSMPPMVLDLTRLVFDEVVVLAASECLRSVAAPWLAIKLVAPRPRPTGSAPFCDPVSVCTAPSTLRPPHDTLRVGTAAPGLRVCISFPSRNLGDRRPRTPLIRPGTPAYRLCLGPFFVDNTGSVPGVTSASRLVATALDAS